jgi:hypothetical protein
MKNADKPIYPTLMQQVGDNEFEPTNLHPKSQHRFVPEYSIMTGGLSKREYFAGLAMQGLLSSFMHNAENGFYGKDVVVSTAIEYADELLKQLENE